MEKTPSIVEELINAEKEGTLGSYLDNESSSSFNNVDEFRGLEQYEIIFEHLQVGIALIEASTRKIAYVNKKASELIGLPKEQIIDNICHKFICPSEMGHCPVLDHGQRVDTSKRILLNKHGEKIRVLKNVTPIRINNKLYLIDNFISIESLERKQDEKKRNKEKTIIDHQQALLTLSKKNFKSFADSISYILKLIVQTLGVSRCGYWVFNHTQNILQCQELYSNDSVVKTNDVLFHSEECPYFFNILEQQQVIDVSDVPNDPRICELRQQYLLPYNIVSIIVIPIRFNGSLISILTIEKTEKKKVWDETDISFIRSISDVLHVFLEKQHRMNIEQQLKQSNRQADAILEAAADGIRIVTTDYKVISANKTMETLTGLPREHIIGNHCSNAFFSNNYCGTEECSLKKVISTGKGFSRESIRKTADGRTINCIEVISPYTDEHGTIIGIIEDFRDITTIKKTEQQLIKEKKKTQEYLNVANVIIIVLDRKGIVSLINKKGCQTLGYEKEEIVGKNWFETVSPPETIEKQKTLFNQFITGTIPFPKEAFDIVITKNGDKRIINWNSTVISDEGESNISMLSSGEDITEETRAKEAKRKADAIMEKRNRSFRILYDTALQVEHKSRDEVITVLCANLTTISNAQTSIMCLYDHKKETLHIYRLENTVSITISKEQDQTLKQMGKESFETYTINEFYETPLFDDILLKKLPRETFDETFPDDSMVYQVTKPFDTDSFITAFIVKNNTEKLEMKDMIDTYLHFASIILRRVHSLEELEASEKRYKHLSNILEEKVEERTAHIQTLLKQKDIFITQLGHDLKHPLNPLINLLPILERKNTDPTCDKILEVLKRNTDYMKNLVTKTITFAQLNAPSTTFSFENIDVYNEINTILQDRTCLFETNNIQVENKVEPGLTVSVDRIRFSELMDNLLHNAVKYNNDHGLITIHGWIEESFFHLMVRDNGIGMNQCELDHIFEEFYKADPARHDFTSSGLGLSICKRIVENHHGTIWVESEGAGRGTTVHILLPTTHKKSI